MPFRFDFYRKSVSNILQSASGSRPLTVFHRRWTVQIEWQARIEGHPPAWEGAVHLPFLLGGGLHQLIDNVHNCFPHSSLLTASPWWAPLVPCQCCMPFYSSTRQPLLCFWHCVWCCRQVFGKPGILGAVFVFFLKLVSPIFLFQERKFLERSVKRISSQAAQKANKKLDNRMTDTTPCGFKFPPSKFSFLAP